MSKKQREHVDNQSFANNLFETSNTNTPIYINREKEKERKIISSTEKEEEKEGKPKNAVNSRNVPSAPPRPDNHSLWNDRLKCWELEYG